MRNPEKIKPNSWMQADIFNDIHLSLSISALTRAPIDTAQAEYSHSPKTSFMPNLVFQAPSPIPPSPSRCACIRLLMRNPEKIKPKTWMQADFSSISKFFVWWKWIHQNLIYNHSNVKWTHRPSRMPNFQSYPIHIDRLRIVLIKMIKIH
jgi:hypothetical protein